MAVILRLLIVFSVVMLLSLGWAGLAVSWLVLPVFVRIVFVLVLLVLAGVLAVIVESWSTSNEPAE